MKPHSQVMPRSSHPSVDDLDPTTGTSTPSNMSFGTEAFERRMQSDGRVPCRTFHDDGGDEWDVLQKEISSRVHLDTTFYEYPKPEHFQQRFLDSQQSAPDESSTSTLNGIKMFVGGMRYEVVQAGRHVISWILEQACLVNIPEANILLHRKSKAGKPSAPTGCASVFIPNDVDVLQLLAMNQRIFCGAKGIHVAKSASKMEELIKSRAILDIFDGKLRGPQHPMVIERALNSVNPQPPHYSFTTSCISSLQSSFGPQYPSSNGSIAAPPEYKPQAPEQVQYHRYEGEGSVILSHGAEVPNAESVFVGGLCYEATPSFVAWMFGVLGISLLPASVTLYLDNTTGYPRGCAQVRMSEKDFITAQTYQRRILCDATGFFLASNNSGIAALQQSRQCTTRGPTHAVVIEKRKARPPPYNPNAVQAPPLTQPVTVCWIPTQV